MIVDRAYVRECILDLADALDVTTQTVVNRIRMDDLPDFDSVDAAYAFGRLDGAANAHNISIETLIERARLPVSFTGMDYD